MPQGVAVSATQRGITHIVFRLCGRMRSLPRSPCAMLTPHAGVAQLVERLLPMQKVESSRLFSRSTPTANALMRL